MSEGAHHAQTPASRRLRPSDQRRPGPPSQRQGRSVPTREAARRRGGSNGTINSQLRFSSTKVQGRRCKETKVQLIRRGRHASLKHGPAGRSLADPDRVLCARAGSPGKGRRAAGVGIESRERAAGRAVGWRGIASALFRRRGLGRLRSFVGNGRPCLRRGRSRPGEGGLFLRSLEGFRAGALHGGGEGRSHPAAAPRLRLAGSMDPGRRSESADNPETKNCRHPLRCR